MISILEGFLFNFQNYFSSDIKSHRVCDREELGTESGTNLVKTWTLKIEWVYPGIMCGELLAVKQRVC